MTPTSVGFSGFGAMGAPLAANLVRAGFEVRVWNRTATKLEPLGASGATPCPIDLHKQMGRSGEGDLGCHGVYGRVLKEGSGQ